VNPWPEFSNNGAGDRARRPCFRSFPWWYILSIAHALTTGGMRSSVVKSTQTARCCVCLKHDLLFRRPCQRRIACSSLPPARSPCSSPSVVLRSSAHSTPGSPPCVRLSFVLVLPASSQLTRAWDAAPTQSGSWTDVVSPDPGARFPAEKGRYHLYAAKFCPCASHAVATETPADLRWGEVAQRALILLKLKGIEEDVISTSIVHWFKGVAGTCSMFPLVSTANASQMRTAFILAGTSRRRRSPRKTPGCTPDPLFGAHYLSEIYFKAEPNYTGKYTVPVLWDKMVSLARPLFRQCARAR
jgi:hypothetical protein